MNRADDEGGQKVVVIHPESTERGVQDVPQFFGVSGESARAEGLSMNVTVFPPGGNSIAHEHRGYETAIYAIDGRVALFYGDRLEQEATLEPGAFLFIPAGVPHKAYNLSATETATSVTARNDPREQENVVLTPEADDGTSAERIARRRAE